jgi:hypothetical protein
VPAPGEPFRPRRAGLLDAWMYSVAMPELDHEMAIRGRLTLNAGQAGSSEFEARRRRVAVAEMKFLLRPSARPPRRRPERQAKTGCGQSGCGLCTSAGATI